MARRAEKSLSFEGRLDNLGAVSDLIQGVCGDLGLDDVTSYHVELAVVEAVTNGMRHAVHDQASRPMQVSAVVEDGKLLLSVSDCAQPAELRLAERCAKRRVPAELQEGGRGLFLICSLMDHVEHRSSSAGNTLLMTKALPPAAGPR